MPASRSRSSGPRAGEHVDVRAGVAVGQRPAAAMAPAVRQRDRAGRHLVGHEHRHADAPARDSSVARLAVLEPAGRGVVGMHAQRLHPAAAHQQRRVVHPGVVRAQLAQADQQQREVRVVLRRPAGGRARRAISAGASCRRLRGVRSFAPSTPVATCSASTTPCGCLRQRAQREARRGAGRTGRPRGPVRSSRSISVRGRSRRPGLRQPAQRPARCRARCRSGARPRRSPPTPGAPRPPARRPPRWSG